MNTISVITKYHDNFSTSIRAIKSMGLRWAGHVARLEEDSDFKILTDTPTGTRPLRRPRHRREDNIRMGLKEIGINIRN